MKLSGNNELDRKLAVLYDWYLDGEPLRMPICFEGDDEEGYVIMAATQMISAAGCPPTEYYVRDTQSPWGVRTVRRDGKVEFRPRLHPDYGEKWADERERLLTLKEADGSR